MLSARQWFHRENRTDCEEPPPDMHGRIRGRYSSRHVMPPQQPTWPQHCITSRAPKLHSTPRQPLFNIHIWPFIMSLWVYSIHINTRGNPVLSSVTRRPWLIHGHHDKWQCLQAKCQSYLTNRRVLSKKISPVMNHLHPWLKSAAPRPAPHMTTMDRPLWPLMHLPVYHSWDVQLQKLRSTDPQDLPGPLTDWIIDQTKKKHLCLIVKFKVTCFPWPSC